MISKEYAQKILNAIFHTDGVVGGSPDEEMQKLIDDGVPKDGVTAEEYFNRFKAAEYAPSKKIELNDEFTEHISVVNKSTFYEIEYAEPEEFTYPDPITKKDATIMFIGWKIKRSIQKSNYPTASFLALFTHMPDQFGDNYTEPKYTASGDLTNYMRVNLHEGIITGGKTLRNAFKDEVNGGAVIDNIEIIAYPEVEGVSWGDIVGFGVFEEEEVTAGKPVFWGEINNGERVPANINRVPLFRAGNFKITLK